MDKDKRLKLENELVGITKQAVEMIFSMGYDMGYEHKTKFEANKKLQEFLDEDML